MSKLPNLTQLKMDEKQLSFAKKIAEGLGYRQTAYSTTSSINGLHCLPDYDGHKSGCIVLTKEMGFLFVATLDDLCLHDLAEEEREQWS